MNEFSQEFNLTRHLRPTWFKVACDNIIEYISVVAYLTWYDDQWQDPEDGVELF